MAMRLLVQLYLPVFVGGLRRGRRARDESTLTYGRDTNAEEEKDMLYKDGMKK
jgi:hypothetical protein